ncbi:phage terminase large subunit family protein [Cellulosilyticum sp. ST5]|uniref:phage terminase large subunit family protein n=1 Tax=Cellulosilyticum sp. ST5 TaxID=3055805 RepID=UPI003977D2FB
MKKKKIIRKNTLEIFKNTIKVLEPPPNLKLSEWADENRRLSAEASAEQGRWNTDRAPYQREIMDSISDDRYQNIVVKSSSQVGKTEIVLNTIGYIVDHEPSPMLVVQPTETAAEDFSKDRLANMIRDTPCIRDKIKPSKSRDSENTILKKKFPGGILSIVGANSPVGLSAKPIRVVLFDEVDRYPASAGVDGDPVDLGEKRTNTFWNRKIIKVSTPTIKGISRIDQEYETSSKGVWNLRCPCCGRYNPLEFRRLRFEDANMQCMHCDEYFSESEWKEQDGKWIHEFNDNKIRGFHLNELASPWKSWSEIIASFKKAMKKKKETGSIEQLKAFINTSLGEVWEDRADGDQVEDEDLLKRREYYSSDLKDGAILITAGVDVQDDRFEVEVVAWGRGYESWGIQYKKIKGDLDKDDVWKELEEYLDTEFFFEDGRSLLIAATCIDTGGHFTDKAYAFIKRMERKHKRIYGIKGQGGIGIPLVYKQTTNTKTGVRIFMLGVDQGKELIMARLKTKEVGPGYCHFPKNIERGYDEIYMKGINSEQRLIRFVKGRPRLEWVKKSGTRNEPLDLRNYATAAVDIINPNWDSLESKVLKGINYMKSQPKSKRSRPSGVVNRGVEV